jgi:hypothetical protein
LWNAALTTRKNVQAVDVEAREALLERDRNYAAA